MPAITFPPHPTRLDYVASPWTDPGGGRWLYRATQGRWHPVVSPLDGGATSVAVGDTPPENPIPGRQWFRTVDGVLYTFFNGYWVSGNSAPIPSLDAVWDALDTKLPKDTPVLTVTSQNSTTLSTHANAYLRFMYAGAKTYEVPVADGMAIGSLVTLRNASPSGSIVISATLGVTILGELPSFTIPLNGSAQLFKAGTNLFDLL